VYYISNWGNELASYQQLVPFILKVRVYKFNEREVSVFYNFMENLYQELSTLKKLM